MLRRFALIYLGFAVLLGAALYAIARFDDHARVAQLAASELRFVGVARERAEKDFESAEGDLRILAGMEKFQRYLDSGDPVLRDRLERIFLLMSRERQHYDQIRYIDVSGHEVIRVNFNHGDPEAVPGKTLQDKSDRYYFREAMRAGPNEVYVSPLDLNEDFGQLEMPYKPTIRFAMPVFDSAGRKHGVVVLNYLAEEMLQHMRRALKAGSQGVSMVLNHDGYWLSSPVHQDEWGFMLGHPERTFGHDHPEVWRAISSNVTGTIRTAEGLFAYTTARPLNTEEHASLGPVSGGAHRGDGYDWKIVSFVSAEQLAEGAFYNKTTGRVIMASAFVLLALTIFGFSFVAARNRRAEAATREMAQLLEMAPGPVMRIDRRGVVDLANSACKRLYGMQEVAGMSVHSAIPGMSHATFERLFDGGDDTMGHESMIDDASYFFVFRHDPEHASVFAYGTDISDIKLLEQQVRQAQKMEVVGQLAGGVAHDFNTLLGVILGYGEMLMDTLPEGSLSRSNMDSILNAGRRAKSLVKQLMEFSRLGTTRQEPVRLSELLGSTLRLLRPSLPEKIAMEQDIRATSATVQANAVQIGQVVMNLCMNAADAMGERGGHLRVSLVEQEVDAGMAQVEQVRSGSYLRLSVEDNGCGMDAATLQHLFEPFFTTKEVGRGTGLGLAVVHGIVKSHGGFVRVQSEPGRGSRFDVYLPQSRESWVRS